MGAEVITVSVLLRVFNSILRVKWGQPCRSNMCKITLHYNANPTGNAPLSGP